MRTAPGVMGQPARRGRIWDLMRSLGIAMCPANWFAPWPVGLLADRAATDTWPPKDCADGVLMICDGVIAFVPLSTTNPAPPRQRIIDVVAPDRRVTQPPKLVVL